ncbi:MAG TPA: hypothetical protein VJG32_14845 [Anaerolineae bacterium]|nr:hypothetical protein [Anaerolineae bacterium]
MNRCYRYAPTLRVLGLFGAMLAGGVLLGSVLAEIEAADAPDLILHGLGAIAGAIILWLGVEFGTRQIRPTPDGLSTRLLRERMLAWRELRQVRESLFGALLILPKRGLPIVIWPFIEDFGALLAAIETAGWGTVRKKRDPVQR